MIETADRCKRLARLGREIAAELDDMGDAFMAKAVALDTAREKKASRS